EQKAGLKLGHDNSSAAIAAFVSTLAVELFTGDLASNSLRQRRHRQLHAEVNTAVPCPRYQTGIADLATQQSVVSETVPRFHKRVYLGFSQFRPGRQASPKHP